MTDDSSRYIVVRQLGHGAFATVWLTWDRRAAMSTAIRVCRSNSRPLDRELRMHGVLLKSSLELPIKDPMLDSFQHADSNGEHACLVFEPMGPDMTSLFRSLLGLHYQHRIAYCDMDPGNLLAMVDTKQLRKQIMSPESRNDTATVKNQRTSDANHSVEVKIKLADLGAAFPFGELPEDTVIPIALRAPEVILKSAFDHHIDVWSFGCLAFEILTGDNLFSVFPLPIDLDDQIDDDHLLQIANTLGPIPSSIFARWSRGSRCLDGDMK
ncbi:unnamed protein product [Zymoseptoria tritici ST99CH_3D7]|uniref:non-specific serine/threonine protein kinase n=1 Tax=Zymoseptoria tritici (strain ST99CH_3D7) TaxID=1276538 RepID=A0A1X7RQR2_ZYMT9|nr:unnamed protein product [Zymoseptoria tritici ST99CH_3D7]